MLSILLYLKQHPDSPSGQVARYLVDETIDGFETLAPSPDSKADAMLTPNHTDDPGPHAFDNTAWRLLKAMRAELDAPAPDPSPPPRRNVQSGAGRGGHRIPTPPAVRPPGSAPRSRQPTPQSKHPSRTANGDGSAGGGRPFLARNNASSSPTASRAGWPAALLPPGVRAEAGGWGSSLSDADSWSDFVVPDTMDVPVADLDADLMALGMLPLAADRAGEEDFDFGDVL